MTTPIIETFQQPVERLAQIQRPARALLGWMEEKQAVLFQAGQRTDRNAPGYVERAELARTAVAARRPDVDQADLLSDVPMDLHDHIEALRQPAGAFFDEGWSVAIADLRKVCGVQTHVFTDHTGLRTTVTDPTDLRSLAAITLPLPTQAELPAQFDQVRQAWILSAANPNLRIVGNWAGPLNQGVIGLGFAVSLTPSYLQVARFQNRFLLRDGYHRAYGFLRRGIFHVPAFFRDFGPFQDLGLPPGTLPQSAYLGDRPPILPDYLDDAVSADVMLPAFQKMIVIHGMELTPIG